MAPKAPMQFSHGYRDFSNVHMVLFSPSEGEALQGLQSYADENTERNTGSAGCSTGGQRPLFCVIMHLMMENSQSQQYEDICTWLPHGRAFLILDRMRFESEVLPKYFRNQRQFTSFQRQLNMYGFKRITRRDEEHGAYYHEMFLRGRPDLARQICRLRTKGTCSRQRNRPELEPDFRLFPPVLPSEVASVAISPIGNAEANVSTATSSEANISTATSFHSTTSSLPKQLLSCISSMGAENNLESVKRANAEVMLHQSGLLAVNHSIAETSFRCRGQDEITMEKILQGLTSSPVSDSTPVTTSNLLLSYFNDRSDGGGQVYCADEKARSASESNVNGDVNGHLPIIKFSRPSAEETFRVETELRSYDVKVPPQVDETPSLGIAMHLDETGADTLASADYLCSISHETRGDNKCHDEKAIHTQLFDASSRIFSSPHAHPCMEYLQQLASPKGVARDPDVNSFGFPSTNGSTHAVLMSPMAPCIADSDGEQRTYASNHRKQADSMSTIDLDEMMSFLQESGLE